MVDQSPFLQLTGAFSKGQWLALIWTARFSGSLSIVASLLLIFMILRGDSSSSYKSNSKRRQRGLNFDKLKYQLQNRLIFGMSIFDVCNSLALGLSTAPIPKELNYIYHGARGNKTTCSLQAFFIILGTTVPQYNAILCLYYLLVIRFNVKDRVLEKYEKYMHAYAIIPTFITAIIGASLGMLNPGKLDYCGLGDGCVLLFAKESDPDCHPHHESLKLVIKSLMLTFGSIAFLIILVSMTLIYLSVHKQAEKMKKYQSFKNRNSLGGGGGENDKGGLHHETLIQSSLYVLAFLLTFIWPSIVAVVGNSNFSVALGKAIFFPLQGFWNFITYIRPRFVTLRSKKKNKSFWWILKVAVFGSREEKGNTTFTNHRQSKNISKKTKSTKAYSTSRLEMIQRAKESNGPKLVPTVVPIPTTRKKENTMEENIQSSPPSTARNITPLVDDENHNTTPTSTRSNKSRLLVDDGMKEDEDEMDACSKPEVIDEYNSNVDEESKMEISAGSWINDERFDRLSDNVERNYTTSTLDDCVVNKTFVSLNHEDATFFTQEDLDLNITAYSQYSPEQSFITEDYDGRRQQEEQFLSLTSLVAQDVFIPAHGRQSRRSSLPSIIRRRNSQISQISEVDKDMDNRSI